MLLKTCHADFCSFVCPCFRGCPLEFIDLPTNHDQRTSKHHRGVPETVIKSSEERVLTHIAGISLKGVEHLRITPNDIAEVMQLAVATYLVFAETG